MIIFSIFESDDVGYEVEEGVWERSRQGLGFQTNNVRSLLLFTYTNRLRKHNLRHSFRMWTYNGVKTREITLWH